MMGERQEERRSDCRDERGNICVLGETGTGKTKEGKEEKGHAIFLGAVRPIKTKIQSHEKKKRYKKHGKTAIDFFFF